MKLYKVTLRGFGRTAEMVIAKDHKAAHSTISNWLTEQELEEHELKCIELVADSDQSSEVSDGWQDIAHLHLPHTLHEGLQSKSDEVDDITVRWSDIEAAARALAEKVEGEDRKGLFAGNSFIGGDGFPYISDDHDTDGWTWPEQICFTCWLEYGAQLEKTDRFEAWYRLSKRSTVDTCEICGNEELCANPADLGHLKDDSKPLYGDPASFKAVGVVD
tara:strand:+ start:558 stop:1211 length:654 start_codon:yes stop_codon:yes gene_type:complete